MKKLLLLFLVSTTALMAQDLTITGGKSITIKNGSSLSTSGLILSPSVDYTLTSSFSKSSTAVTSGSDNSIANVVIASSDLENYAGNFTLCYKDGELNSLDESSLTLATKNGTGAWIAHTGTVDTDANTITTTISSAETFSKITAFASGVLAIDNIDTAMQIQLYPNPTVSKVHINANETLEIEVYNVIGKKVLSTQEKTIDLSNLQSGLYVFRITDTETKRTNTYKIIKK